STIRFGNVLGTVGSVVPIVKTQIRKGEPITLTNPNMTRPFMSIEQAIELVIKILFISEGGEIIMRKMPRFRTGDLINLLIKHCAEETDKVKIKTIGRRPGEKMHEETYYDYEKDFAHIYDNDIIIINFAKKGNIPKMEGALLSEEQLEEILKKFEII
ncbi:MAG: polysaccharide biosynthesis protein, partial [Thermoplasmatales archaeon]|nr:polysaccharide biosynthesis protein [Thermoplasmatales archaeon]